MPKFLLFFPLVKNKFPPVFRGVASYFPRFSSSSRQNKLRTPQPFDGSLTHRLRVEWRKRPFDG